MKKCELCSHIARIYCHSDNASLCYTCDQTVHSSNFLVAKHSRTLLCHKCQSPTPWTAAGLNLGRAATVCVTCLHRNDVVEEQTDGDDDDDDDDTESSDDDEDEDEVDDDDDDAENQVVPWSSSTVVSAPVVNGSSSDEGSSSRFSCNDLRSARNREGLNANYIDSEDDSLCSSERCNGKRSTEIRLASFRPLKVVRSNRN